MVGSRSAGRRHAWLGTCARLDAYYSTAGSRVGQDARDWLGPTAVLAEAGRRPTHLVLDMLLELLAQLRVPALHDEAHRATDESGLS
jgi:hypothetical protein